MKTYTLEPEAWLGLDAHAHFSLLAWIDQAGERQGHWRFPTNEREIISHIKAIPGTKKNLAVEESGLGRWITQVAKPYVTRAIVCDPRENYHISRHHHKCDEEDGYGLAHLDRLGALKEVYQAVSDERAVFKCAVQGYLDAVDRQSALKLQLKAHYRPWGVIPTGSTVYSAAGRESWLLQVKQPGIRAQIEVLYEMLDSAVKVESKARHLMIQLGRPFPEINRLKTVPGVGIVGAHLFVAFIQEPTRFETPQQLFRYSRLGIRDRSSDNKPLGYQQLDRQGHSVLKALSYRAWLTAIKRRKGAVYEFYRQSLERTCDGVHARLNTQRKILRTMKVMWEKQQDFDSEQFLGTAAQPTAKATCG